MAVGAGDEFDMRARLLSFFSIILTVSGLPGLLLAGPASSPTPIASALGWFTRWYSSSNSKGTQSCEGEYRNGKMWMACTPLSAQVLVIIGPNGECSINSVEPDFKIPSMFTFTPSRQPLILPGRHLCDGVPQKEGEFKISVTPIMGKTDVDLSELAKRTALNAMRFWRRSGCVAKFPLIYHGDPTFQVYITCDGRLWAIEEYEIASGKPEVAPRGYDSFHKREPSSTQIGRLLDPRLWYSYSAIGPDLR